MASQKVSWWAYEKEQIENAAKDVSLGVPLLTAARNHGVPRTSLRRYVQGGEDKFKNMGRSPVLTKEEEETLVLWIASVAKAGFPVSRDDLLDSVQKLLKDLNRKNDFVNGRPGRSWYENFLKRNPSISTRVAQNLTITRASVTVESLEKWFSEVFEYLKENGLEGILLEPNRVYNADETAFSLNPKGNKVLALKGSKSVYQQINSNEKECITVLIMGNADGQLGPPLVVFKYTRIPQELVNSVPGNWGLGKSENGWMTGALFYEYLTNVFFPWLIEHKIPQPVVLFVDGHTSYLTLHTSRFCHDNGIILVSLFPNATHVLQPMDVAVFRSLKENWKQKVHEWRRENVENPILKKKDFCPLLKQVLDEKISPIIIQNGFKKCGLVPWDPSAPFKTIRKNPSLYVTVQHNQGQLKAAFNILEEYIGCEKVDSFKQYATWTGPDEDKNLFNVWHKMKIDISKNEEALTLPENEIVEEENGDQGIASVHSTEDKDYQHHPAEICSLSMDDDCQETVSLEATNDSINKSCDTFQRGTDNTDIPSPFKRSMYWPEESKKRNVTKKKRLFAPPVVTSEKWREHNESKQKRKMELEKQKEERKLERQKKKEEKEMMARRKAEERAQKKLSTSKRNVKRKKKKSILETISSEEEEDSWRPSGSSADDISFGVEDDDLVLEEMESSDVNATLENLEMQGELEPEVVLNEILGDGNKTDDKIMSTRSEIYVTHFEPSSSNHVKYLNDRLLVEEPQENEIESAMDKHKEEEKMEEKRQLIETKRNLQTIKKGNTKDVTEEEDLSKPPIRDETVQKVCGSVYGIEECGNESFEGEETVVAEDIREGDFVLMSFSGKRKECKAVCQIKELYSEVEADVVVLNHCNRMRNVFVLSDREKKKVSVSQIILKLPMLLIFGSLEKRYQFPHSVDVG